MVRRGSINSQSYQKPLLGQPRDAGTVSTVVKRPTSHSSTPVIIGPNIQKGSRSHKRISSFASTGSYNLSSNKGAEMDRIRSLCANGWNNFMAKAWVICLWIVTDLSVFVEENKDFFSSKYWVNEYEHGIKIIV